MKILQICPRVPFPLTDGGAIAMYDVAKGLSDRGHEVTVLAINTPKHFQESNVLEGIVNLETVYVNTNISAAKAFINLFSKVPYNIERFISVDVERVLFELLQHEHFDVIQFEGTFVAYYVELVKQFTDSRTVLRVHNLEYRIWERLAKNASGFKKWYFNYLSQGIRKFEKKLFRKFDALASISELETREMLEGGYNRQIVTIPAGVDLGRLETQAVEPEPETIGMIGALNWKPNIEAVFWFVQEVFPEVLKQNPDIVLHIAGVGTPPEVFDLASDSIKVHGFVESAHQFMQRYQLMLVPLLSGGGMRIKIIEGMALGKCILSSSVGAEGINYTDGKDLVICNQPEEWVQAILELTQNPDQVREIGLAAQKTGLEYDNHKIIERFEQLYLNQ